MVTGTWMKMDTNLTSTTTSLKGLGISSTSTKPPTYTTAGTIYNPKSTQPLQAPTRRGRPQYKWPPGHLESEGLVLFPRSAIETLPLSGAGLSRTTTVHTYSPLQQNYDRAVSPSISVVQDSDYQSDMMVEVESPISTFGIETPIQELVYGSDEDKPDVNYGLEEDSDDAGMAPLRNMTVHSLKNLASYPNPQQELAKKALSRGMRPCFSKRLIARGSLSPPRNRPICPTPVNGVHETCMTQPSGTSSGPHWLYAQYYAGVNENGLPSWSKSNLRENTEHDRYDLPVCTAGSGPPQPLTAGPPGQRQYRPSTFESTFKALHVKIEQQMIANENSRENIDKSLSMVGGGMTGGSAKLSLTQEFNRMMMSDRAPVTKSESVISHTSKLSREGDHQHQEALDAQPALPHSSWKDGSTPLDMSFYRPNPLAEKRYARDSPVGRMTDEDLRARNEKVERHWSSGAGFLSSHPRDVITEEKFRMFEAGFGVIGDRRPKAKINVYIPLDVEEASLLPAHHHAKPLLNMVFASMLRADTEEHLGSALRVMPVPQAWMDQKN